MNKICFEDGTYLPKLIFQKKHEDYIVGLCSGWDLPETYQHLDVDIIGTLYTKAGALTILRNLFANPVIKVLIILDVNPLGHNQVGNQGVSLLYKLFFQHETANIPYNPFIIDDLYQKLFVFYVKDEAISVHHGNLTYQIRASSPCDALCGILREFDTSDFLDRESFVCPPEEIKTPTYYPNDYLGRTIRGDSIFDSWFQTLQHVYHYGFSNGEGL